MNILSSLGNIPVNSSTIASLYPEIKGKNQKISELEKANEIIRLKRGMYVVHPNISGKLLSTELIANHIYGPSYISMQSALRYYGLIPETVYTMRSMTIKRSRCFENSIGRFDYLCCPREYFPIGLTQLVKADYSFIIATPEKALCDLIAYTPNLNLRYRKELITYLEEDIRLDMEAFYEMKTDVFRLCASYGKKKTAINTIINILER
ncbi:type IV toxin-antitoxin system AbiEi family antitoxin domain-containing protein [Phocaeicola sp.]